MAITKATRVGVKRDENSRGGCALHHRRHESRRRNQDQCAAQQFSAGRKRRARRCCSPAASASRRCGAWRRSLPRVGRSWKLYYACRSRDDSAVLGTLEARSAKFRHLHYDIEAGGKVLDLEAAVAATPAGAHLDCCGPNPMLKAFEAATASRPRNLVHV